MARVLFGVTASPFLLAATLRFHFKKYQDSHPDLCATLDKNLYVDDLLTGAETVANAIKIRQESRNIMGTAGMNLRKWVSNSEELRANWAAEEAGEKPLNTPPVLKVLGITWNPATDTFTFDVSALLEFLLEKKNTKRGVLQAAARVFDPIGFISPFLINVKCLFQKLWLLGMAWDANLPMDLQEEWDQWCQDLAMVQKISVPRFYYDIAEEKPVRQEIHMFCDASGRAYGAVVYLRYETPSGKIRVSLISSTTRVAPLQKLTMPRLERMAAVILARLLKFTLDALEGDIKSYRCRGPILRESIRDLST